MLVHLDPSVCLFILALLYNLFIMALLYAFFILTPLYDFFILTPLYAFLTLLCSLFILGLLYSLFILTLLCALFILTLLCTLFIFTLLFFLDPSVQFLLLFFLYVLLQSILKYHSQFLQHVHFFCLLVSFVYLMHFCLSLGTGMEFLDFLLFLPYSSVVLSLLRLSLHSFWHVCVFCLSYLWPISLSLLFIILVFLPTFLKVCPSSLCFCISCLSKHPLSFGICHFWTIETLSVLGSSNYCAMILQLISDCFSN